MTAPKRGHHYWLLLSGSKRFTPAKLGMAGWYVIGECGVVNETAIDMLGPEITLDPDFEPEDYATVKMTMGGDAR